MGPMAKAASHGLLTVGVRDSNFAADEWLIICEISGIRLGFMELALWVMVAGSVITFLGGCSLRGLFEDSREEQPMSQWLQFSHLTPVVRLVLLGVFAILLVASAVSISLIQLKPNKDWSELRARIRTWWVIAALVAGSLLLSPQAAICFFLHS